VKAAVGKARWTRQWGEERNGRTPKQRQTYHHGSLREALLQAAERIPDGGGIRGPAVRRNRASRRARH